MLSLIIIASLSLSDLLLFPITICRCMRSRVAIVLVSPHLFRIRSRAIALSYFVRTPMYTFVRTFVPVILSTPLSSAGQPTSTCAQRGWPRGAWFGHGHLSAISAIPAVPGASFAVLKEWHTKFRLLTSIDRKSKGSSGLEIMQCTFVGNKMFAFCPGRHGSCTEILTMYQFLLFLLPRNVAMVDISSRRPDAVICLCKARLAPVRRVCGGAPRSVSQHSA